MGKNDIRSSHIAANIRRLRAERGLTQLELAEAADLSNVAIVQIETGRRANPRSDTLEAIARALKVPLDALYTDQYATEKQPKQAPRPRLSDRIIQDGPAFSDVGPIMERLASSSPRKRAFLLAVLFEDSSLAEGFEDLEQVFDQAAQAFPVAK